jgi:hypothetical protein
VVGVTTEMQLLAAVKERDHRRIAETMGLFVEKVKELKTRWPR